MKHFLVLLLCLLPVAHAADGGYATPADFGYPPLSLEPPQYLSPATEREWHITGQPALRATLQGIRGRWGNEATIILRTPSGRDRAVPAYALSNADLDAVSDWLKKNNFEEFETFREGTSLVHVHSVIPVGKEYHVNLIMTDGSRIALRTNAEPANREFAIKQPPNAFQVTDATLEMLRRHSQRKPENKPELPIASSIDEATLYAATHDVGIAHFLLNRRGGAIDLAFRHYLANKPELVARWAQHFVFLIAYSDEQGMYPAECHDGDLTLALTHGFQGTHPVELCNTSSLHNKLRLAWLTNTSSLGFTVYLHNRLSGNPYQRKINTVNHGGNVSVDSMLRLRDNQFNLFGH